MLLLLLKKYFFSCIALTFLERNFVSLKFLGKAAPRHTEFRIELTDLVGLASKVSICGCAAGVKSLQSVCPSNCYPKVFLSTATITLRQNQ